MPKLTHKGIRAKTLTVGTVTLPTTPGAAVAAPTGGSTTDTEARAAITALIARLVAAGIIAGS